jgi:NADPH:quinone reductase-like Zn-dependent oxidoreductase
MAKVKLYEGCVYKTLDCIQDTGLADQTLFHYLPGSDEKVKECIELGADGGINYKTEDFVERVKALTDGKGVDVILDIVGGPYVNKNLEALGRDGRLFILGLQGGPKGEINLGPIIAKRLTITGT